MGGQVVRTRPWEAVRAPGHRHRGPTAGCDVREYRSLCRGALQEKLEEPFVPQRITVAFDEKQAEHVDPYTLTLFRVDLESRTFTPVDSSRVDVDKMCSLPG